jgi:hypothetical protein
MPPFEQTVVMTVDGPNSQSVNVFSFSFFFFSTHNRMVEIRAIASDT